MLTFLQVVVVPHSVSEPSLINCIAWLVHLSYFSYMMYPSSARVNQYLHNVHLVLMSFHHKKPDKVRFLNSQLV